ncbi:MAG: nucleotidyl transferase AbiEii/AbiGii toxin family protein [Thermoleophilia bacterium]
MIDKRELLNSHMSSAYLRTYRFSEDLDFTLSDHEQLDKGGPLQRRGSLPRIKLDLTDDEILVMEPIAREVYHPYADRPEGPIRVHCYSFEETFAEKIRALAERGRPRDLYDVVNIFRHDELRPDPAKVLDVLKKKCSFKEIAVPDKELFENEPLRDELVADWESM